MVGGGDYNWVMTTHIQVEQLTKEYQVHQKEPGFAGSIRSFLKRTYETVTAVNNISLSIAGGEMVGFLGPNGAGKTTTLKVLSGLLHPTHGRATVLGYTPHERDHDYLRQMTLVMGNKNQLIWDLPASESFLVNKAIYEISDRDYQKTLGEFNDLLDLSPVLNKQVRKLSLGERMKCELAAALLHKPKVLFLDEPTLGLDVTMQIAIREFITTYNAQYGATIILTSHYMADVTALTKRIIVISGGNLLYDGDLQALVEQIAPYKLLSLTLKGETSSASLAKYGKIHKEDGRKISLQVPRGEGMTIAAQILQTQPIEDLLIEDPPVEEIIRQVFAEGLTTPSEKPSHE